MKRKIFVLEFITSVGGVQTVYKNILPQMCDLYEVYFCDPYQDNFDKEISSVPGIRMCDLSINTGNKLNWTKQNMLGRVSVLLKNGVSYGSLLLKMVSIVKKEKIELLYVAGKKELIFAYWIQKLTGTPYVFHAHGFNSSSDIGKSFSTWINSARKVIAVSGSVKNVLIDAGIPENSINVVYNGTILPKDFTQYNTGKPFRMVFVGTIQSKKGLHILIPATKELLDEGYNIQLDIVGDDMGIYTDYKKGVIELADVYYQNGINFMGFIPSIESRLKNYNVLVLPSTEVSESFGMVLIEAMANARPVIGARIGGIPEVIEDGYNGILVKPENVSSLIDAIKMFMDNPSKAKEMGMNGRGKVEKDFSVKTQSDKICHIIDCIK